MKTCFYSFYQTGTDAQHEVRATESAQGTQTRPPVHENPGSSGRSGTQVEAVFPVRGPDVDRGGPGRGSGGRGRGSAGRRLEDGAHRSNPAFRLLSIHFLANYSAYCSFVLICSQMARLGLFFTAIFRTTLYRGVKREKDNMSLSLFKPRSVVLHQTRIL